MKLISKYVVAANPIALLFSAICAIVGSINLAFSLTQRQNLVASELGATHQDFISFACGLKSMCKDFQKIAIACSASNDSEYCFEQVGGGSYYLCNKVGGAISSSVASVPPSTLQCIPYIAERLLTEHVRPDLFRRN